MFRFLRQKPIPVSDVARMLFEYTIKESEQDVMFQKQAVDSGSGLEQFNFESLCLRIFASTVASHEVIDGQLWSEFARSWLELLNRHCASLGLDQVCTQRGERTVWMFELINERVMKYDEAAKAHANRQNTVISVEELFSQLTCGDSKNNTLQRIASSILSVRAQSLVSTLSSFRIRSDVAGR
jgi:hypothetical protein